MGILNARTERIGIDLDVGKARTIVPVVVSLVIKSGNVIALFQKYRQANVCFPLAAGQSGIG